MSETGSMVSSQRTVSSVRSRVGSRFFASSFPAFPFFLGLEPRYHYVFSYLGMAVQGLQMLALVLNPHMHHGETLTAASRIIYASHLPFWDDTFTKMTFTQYLPLFCLCVILVLAVLLTGLYLILFRTPVVREHRTMTILRFFLHLSTSVLFIPIIQACLSQMICLDGMMWSFPSTQCYASPSTVATLALSIITFVALTGMTVLVDTTLCIDDYHSQNPLARKQYTNSVLYLIWRALSCVLYHVFSSSCTHPAPSGYAYTWLPMYIFFSAGLMASSYVFYLPFLHQTTNRLFTAAFMCTAMIGIITFFSSTGAIAPAKAQYMDMTDLATMDIDTLFVFGLGGICFVLGWALADWRINKELLRSLKHLTDASAEYPDNYTCLFPAGLPEYSLAYRTSTEMCSDVADGAFKDNRVSVSLETPFLTRIYSYTDVEVATRFISTAFRATGRYPTPEMLRLASHIYVKGMYRYPESVAVVIDFASMISAFTMRPSLALAQCERAHNMACTFPTRYRVYRLHASLKASLHLRDTAYQSTCEDAKRAHKEILVSFSQFWSKLLAPQTDRNQILSTYSMIARKREDANRMFIKALHQQTSDRDLLLNYADFLEQVMLQGERAERLRVLAVEEVEEEQRLRCRPGVQRRRHAKRLEALALKSNSDDMETSHHSYGVRIDTHNVLRVVLLVFLLLIAVALIVVDVVGYRRRMATYQCVQRSSVARNLHSIGGLAMMQYWTVNKPFAKSGPRLNFISSVANDLLSIQNFLVFGLPKSLSGAREQFIGSPCTIGVSFASTNVRQYNAESFLSLGYSYAQFVQDVPGIIARETTAISSTATGSVSAEQSKAQLLAARATLFDDYARDWETSGYNASVLACRSWHDEEKEVFIGVAAGLFGLGVMAVVLLAEVTVQTSPVEQLKNRILSLFDFVPKSKLQEIAQQARMRVEAFDQSGDADDGDSGEQFAFQMSDNAGDLMSGSPRGAVGGTDMSKTTPSEEDLGCCGSAAASGKGRTDSDIVSPLGKAVDSSKHCGTSATGVVAGAFGDRGSEGAGNDEDAGEQHALLWGTEKGCTEPGAALLSRTGLGRRAGEGKGVAVPGMVSLSDRGGGGGSGLFSSLSSPYSGAPGGAATAGNVSIGAGERDERDGNGARSRTVGRSLRPIRRQEHHLLMLLVAVLASVLIVAAVNSRLVRTNRTTQRYFAQHSKMMTESQNNLLIGAVYLTSFFSSGERWFYDMWLTKSTEVKKGLPLILSLSPVDEEMTRVRNVAQAVQGFSGIQSTLDAFAGSISGTTSQYSPLTETVQENEVGEEARDALFVSRGKYNDQPIVITALFNDATEALRSAEQQVTTLSTARAQNTGAMRVTVALIVLSICGATFQLLVVLAIHFRKDSFFLRRSQCGVTLLVLSSCALLTTFILAFFIRKSLKDIAALREEHVSLAGMHQRTMKSYLWPLILTGSMLQQGNRLQALNVLEYFDFVNDDATWRTFATDSLSRGMREQMLACGQRLYDFQLIALALQADVSGLDLIELRDVAWDFSAEPDAMETRIDYADDRGLRYTTSAVDMGRGFPVKLMMARDVVSNARARDTMATLNWICNSYYDSKLGSVMGRLDLAGKRVDTLINASIGTAAAGLFLSAVFILVFLSQHTKRRQDQLGLVKDTLSHDFASSRTWLCLGITLMLLAAIFAVSMADLLSAPRADSQLDELNERSHVVTASMISAEMWSAKELSAASLMTNVRRNWASLNRLNGLLTGEKTSVYGTSRALDVLLKGVDVKLSPQFRYGFNPATGAEQQNESEWTFSYGIDNAVVSWMHRTLEFAEAVTSASAVEIKSALQSMRDSVMPLLRGLDESSHLFLEGLQDSRRIYMICVLALASVLAAFIVAMTAFLLLPIARRQAAEEMGYRMLVRLIPPDIRESIPAIREFVNRDASADAAGRRGRRTVVGGGGGGGGGHRASAHIGLSIVDDFATPTIAINTKGVVIKFNRQAEEVFGYAAAEVLGNNVSMLMPDRIGRLHDSYLANYAMLRKPGNRSVFHGQEMRAKKKNGSLFDVRLTIHEMKRGNSDRAFVGFAEDISAKVRARREEMLSRFVQGEAVAPMIAIDSLGTVIRFNKAAEVCFGRSAAEVLDQNVKILMPEDIAARHDDFLATYLRTKEKHAIDNTARAQGVRKNGEEFPIELRIKEIVHDNVSTYVGFCRDLSTDAYLEEAVQINQAIFQTSVVPVICTDMQGRIILYSQSAERVFGYTTEEAISNNCKMLMPDTVADHHDSYMERYRSSWTKRTAPIMSRKVMGRCKDGRLIPLLACLHEVRSTGSANTAMVGFFRELSEERALERRLNIDEVVAEHHQFPLVVINSKGIIERVNHATVVEFGYRHRDELLHRNVKMLMPEEMAARHDGYISRYLLTGIGVVISLSHDQDVLSAGRRLIAKRRDGSTFPMELRIREVRRASESSGASLGGAGRSSDSGAGGMHGSTGNGCRDRDASVDNEQEEIHFIGYMRNLTHDIRLERQLAINRAAMEYAPSPLCLLDGYGRILKVNAAAELTMRASSSDLAGMTFASMLLPAPAASDGNPGGCYTARQAPPPPSVQRWDEDASQLPGGRRGGGGVSDDVSSASSSGAAPATATAAAAVSAGGGSAVGGLASLLGRTTSCILLTASGHRVPVDVMVKAVIDGNTSGSGCDPYCQPHAERQDSMDYADAQARPGSPAESTMPTARYPLTQHEQQLLSAPGGMSTSASPTTTTASRPRAEAYIAYLRDTTGDDAAVERAARNAAIAELSPLPLVQFDQSGLIVNLNAAAERQLGYPRDEMMGRHLRLVLPDPLVLADVLATAAEAPEVELTVMTSNTNGNGCLPHQGDHLNADGTARLPLRTPRLHEEGTPPLQRRTMTEVRTKGGRLIPVELCVAEVVIQEHAHSSSSTFIAYMYDQSGSVQLEAAKEDCHAYAELSPHPIVTIDADGLILMCNAALCRSFRYSSPSELIGREVGVLMHERVACEHGGYMRAFQKTRQGRRVNHTTMVQCRRADETLFPCSLALREVPLCDAFAGDDADKPSDNNSSSNRSSRDRVKVDKDVVYVGRFVDRSEDGAITCAKRFVDTLLQLSGSAAMLFLTERGEIQRVSTRTVALLGYNSPEELVGQSSNAVLPDFVWRPRAASRPSGQQLHTTSTMGRRRMVTARRQDGTTLTTELHMREVTMGKSTVAVVCLVDAREREKLHVRRKTNQALVEHCPIPVLVIDANGAVRVFSSAAEAFFGYSEAELVSDEATDVLLLLPEMPEDRMALTRMGGDNDRSYDRSSSSATTSARARALSHAGANASSSSPCPSLMPRADASMMGSDDHDMTEGDAGLQRLLLAGAAATAARQRAFGTTANPHATGPWAEDVADAGRLRGRRARLRHGVMVPVDVSVVELPPPDSRDQTQYAIFVMDRSLDTAVATAQQISDAVARSMPLPSMVVSEAGVILEANQHAADFVHYTVSELEGQLVSITVPHRDILHSAVTAPAAGTGGGDYGSSRDALADPVYVRRRVPVLTKDGATKITDAHVCVLPAQGSRPARGFIDATVSLDVIAGASASARSDGITAIAPRVLYVTFVDHSSTTDYRRILERFQTLFYSVSTPVVRLDAESWRVVTFNPAANQLLGVNRDPQLSSLTASSARSSPPSLPQSAATLLPPSCSSGAVVVGGGGTSSSSRSRHRQFGAVAPATEDQDGEDVPMLTDLLTDPHALKQLKRFIARELQRAQAVTDRDSNEVPSLQLRTRMRVLTGYVDDNGNAAAGAAVGQHGPLCTCSATATGGDPLRSMGGATVSTNRPPAVNTHATSSGRPLEVELHFELVGRWLLLYIKDVAMERRQQLHTSLLAAMRSTLHEPYMVVSDDDVIVELSDAASRLLGYHLPPNGTINASRVVEGGIIHMYSEASVGTDAGIGEDGADGGMPVELGFLHVGETDRDTVVATLEVHAGCPFATCAGTDAMRLVRPVSSPAPDQAFEPLVLRHTMAGAAVGSPLVPDLSVGNRTACAAAAATAPPPSRAAAAASTAGTVPAPLPASVSGVPIPMGATTATTGTAAALTADGDSDDDSDERGHIIRAEVRARRRVIMKVPCRCSDGRSVPLDLHLCEVQVPLRNHVSPPAGAVHHAGGASESHPMDGAGGKGGYGDPFSPRSGGAGAVRTNASGSSHDASLVKGKGAPWMGSRLLLADSSSVEEAEEKEEATMARYYVVFLRDVSARQCLDTSIMLGDAIIEKNPCAIVVTNVVGVILKFNAAAERLFRFAREQVLGRNVSLLMSPHDAARHDLYLKNYMRTRTQHVLGAPRIVVAECRDGQHIRVELNMLEVLDDSNVPFMFIGFLKPCETEIEMN